MKGVSLSGEPRRRLVALRDDGMDALKPDCREAKERMIDWWAGRKVDRVVASLVARRDGCEPHRPRGTLVERRTDSAIGLANFEDWLGRTYFGAEGFPAYQPKIGPVQMAAFLGAELVFRDEAIWQLPLGLTWDEAHRITFDRGNKWWVKWRELRSAGCEQARGRFLVADGEGEAALADVMVNLFGHEQTLVAMVERPEAVRELRDRMLVWVREMLDEAHRIVAPYQEGDIDWVHVWAPGTMKVFQCDACVMLSPQVFNDIFLEEIRQECAYVDHSFYHLDGSGEMRHLDALLSIEDLDGIQWTPEPTVPSNPAHFADVWRRVQDAGKKLMFFVRPEHVRPLLGSIGRETVFLSVSCRDETEARTVLRELERIST
jgi:hypothetical protein